MLATKYDNFGYDSVNIVSIGPFYSESLIESLKKYSKKVFFVTDGNLEEDNGYTKSVKEATKNTDLKQIGEVMSYFDIDKILTSEYFLKIFGKGLVDENLSQDALFTYLENKLIKRVPTTYRINNMKELVDNCVNQEKIQELISFFKKEDIEKED